MGNNYFGSSTGEGTNNKDNNIFRHKRDNSEPEFQQLAGGGFELSHGFNSLVHQ
ncbi:hypothetical protein Hanom_Chr03g00197601 [Helianthus anomalus]